MNLQSVPALVALLLVHSSLFFPGFFVNGFIQNPSSFAPRPMHTKGRGKSSTSSYLSLPDFDPSTLDPSVEDARRLFYLWFFGGSGGGGIAIAAFPAMYSRFADMRALKGLGPTQGGETIGLSPLCGFPEDLSRADVEKILNNKMSVERMVETGPKDSFWAERGYLRFEAFEAANKNCNPLALRALFDSMTTSTSTVEPYVAQECLDNYRNDLNAFKTTLLASKFKGYAAIALLLFLLGLATTVSVEALAQGWFPDWPGNENFPVGLLDPGVWTIPEYWI